MKVDIVKQQILNNYKKLSQSITVPKPDKNIVTLWSLSYKQNNINGFVSQIGRIKRNDSALDIVDNEIELIKKPFFSTWSKVLENINTMLQNIIENMENKEVVNKHYLKIQTFNKSSQNNFHNLSTK